MNSSPKEIMRTVIWASTLAHLIAYMLFHLPTLVLDIKSDVVYEAFYYAHDLLYKALSFILPIACSAVALGASASEKKWRPLIRSLEISLTQLPYVLLYGYTYSVVNGGYDAVESLLIAIGVSGGMVVLSASYGFGLCALARLIATRRATRPTPAGAVGIKKAEETQKFGSPFDFSSPYVFGIFSACFVQFCVRLCIELIDIISFLIEFSGNYRAGEIIYIVAVLTLLLICVLASHFLAVTLCTKLRAPSINTEQKEIR